MSEFPVVADFLALAVVAGEAPVDAIHRVCRLTGGQLASKMDSALAASRTGTPITKALSDVAERTTFEPFERGEVPGSLMGTIMTAGRVCSYSRRSSSDQQRDHERDQERYRQHLETDHQDERRSR